DALRAVVPILSGPRRAVCWWGSVLPVGAGHRSVQRCRTDLGAVEGHALVAEVHAAGLIGRVGLPLADLDHDEVRALGLDQRQFVVRLADDVTEAARFTGAVDVGGFDRDRLLAGVQRQLRVLGLVRGLGGLRGLGLIVGLLGVFGLVVGVLGSFVGVLGLGLFTLIDRLRALSVLGCGLLGFIGAGAPAESEESGNGNGRDRSGAHVSIIGEQRGRRRRKPDTTNV